MISDYVESKVVMAPNGELLIALPIYADQSKVIMSAKEVEEIIGVSVSFGVYEQFGFLLYHPKQEFSFYMKSLDLFEVLGDL